MGKGNPLGAKLGNKPNRYLNFVRTPAVSRRAFSTISLTMMSLALVTVVGWAQDTVWTRRFDCGRPGWNEWSAAGAVDRSGDPVLLGVLTRSVEPESTAAAVVKYRQSGEFAWSLVFEDETRVYTSDLAVDAEGNAVSVGYYEYPESTSSGAIAVKNDRSGNPLWTQRLTVGERTGFYGVAIDDSLNVYASGFSSGAGSNGEVLVVKYGPDGDVVWRKTHDFVGYADLAGRSALDRQGYLIAAGSVFEGSWRALLAKFTPDGETTWTRRYDLWLDNLGELHDVQVDNANNIVVCGWGRVSSGEPMRALTAKFSPDGETLWTRTYEAPRHSFGYGVAVDSVCGILTVGGVDDPPLGMTSSCLLLKYTPQGDTEWTRTYRLDAFNHGRAAGFFGTNDLYVFGGTEDSLDENPDMFVMKLRYGSGIEEPELVGAPGRSADHAGPTLLGRGEPVRFSVGATGDYRVSLCDAAGRCIRVLHNGRLEPGEHAFNLANIPAGIYFCRLESGPTRLSRKVVLTAGN